ncbi:unnamed protein product [Durusdinium trenchii]
MHRKDPLSDAPSMNIINLLEAIELSDVTDQAGNMPCMDESYPRSVIRPQLLEVAQVERCAQVDLARCAWRNMTALRALCPETCGCDNAMNPAAGAFASTAFGCPKLCVWKSLRSPALHNAPCEDWTPEHFINDPYVENFLRGMFSSFLHKPEMKDAHIMQYRKQLEEHFWDLLPGPNKTLSLDLAVEHYASLGWVHDVVEGKWTIGLGIPHPRGLTGCAFFGSSEIKDLTGVRICRDRSEFDDFRGLRAQCAQTCECRKRMIGCPRTCPLPVE